MLSLLFIIFGTFAILFPKGMRNNNNKSYTVDDLIQGWGIYACTIGAIIAYPSYMRYILMTCFTASILWHIVIAEKKGWTTHHKQSIIINMFVLCITLNPTLFKQFFHTRTH